MHPVGLIPVSRIFYNHRAANHDETHLTLKLGGHRPWRGMHMQTSSSPPAHVPCSERLELPTLRKTLRWSLTSTTYHTFPNSEWHSTSPRNQQIVYQNKEASLTLPPGICPESSYTANRAGFAQRVPPGGCYCWKIDLAPVVA